jgi:putative sterol carrier protein
MNERKAFGRTINKFQVLRHKMAQLTAEIQSVKTFTYHVCKMHNDKNYCVKEASMVKYLATELSDKVAYQCLQMFGGYGYMEEYKMARFFRDSRLGTIGGGSSEIMLEIISKMVIDDIDYQNRDVRNETKEINIEELFATLPSRLKKEKANGIELNVLFEFENELNYLVEIKNQEVSFKNINDTKLATHDLRLTTTTETYIAVETGKLNPQEVFMSGKIQVSDLGKMMQFSTLFKRFS